MLRLLALAAVVAGAGVAAGSAVPAGPGETLYYGKTSQGLGVSIPVKAAKIPGDLRAYLLWKMIRTGDPLEFHPGPLGAVSFRGGKLAFHRVERLPGGTIEVWFTAVLSRDRKSMTGTFRQRDAGYSAKPKDSGTIRFGARVWASQAGQDWTGSTSDGKTLRAVVGYRLVPGHVVVNGKRMLEPAYRLDLPPTTRPLSCRTGDGAALKVDAALPALSASLRGSDELANSFGYGSGLSGTASGTTAGVQGDLSVKRLAWQGAGIAATGTLSYQGTVTTEAGEATCARTTSSFTLRPR
jgi:hypothetical protein